METITTLSVVLLAVLALAVILEDRSLMYEFLLGNQQPRNAQRIWHEMRGWKKFGSAAWTTKSSGTEKPIASIYFCTDCTCVCFQLSWL